MMYRAMQNASIVERFNVTTNTTQDCIQHTGVYFFIGRPLLWDFFLTVFRRESGRV